MPKTSKGTASQVVEVEGFEGRFEELDGWTAHFETYHADADLAPLFVGLPDDRCQCIHLGHVLKGRVKFTYADGSEEIIEAGESYYAPPGHTPTIYAGTELIEFSPSAELARTLEVVEKNMEAMGAG